MFKLIQCPSCTHWKNDFETSRYTGTCKAFPEGIPDEIFANKFNHTQEYPGDQGVRFEQNPDRSNPHAG